MAPTKNRWYLLIAMFIINLCVGSAYAWSVFQKPLISLFQWSTSDTSLAFSISLFVIPLAMIVGGRIQPQRGPKFLMFTGGIIFSSGITASRSNVGQTNMYRPSKRGVMTRRRVRKGLG